MSGAGVLTLTLLSSGEGPNVLASDLPADSLTVISSPRKGELGAQTCLRVLPSEKLCCDCSFERG